MKFVPNNQDVVLSALMAAGDVAYSWDLQSDQITFFGHSDALFGAGAAVSDGKSFRARLHAEDEPHAPVTEAAVGDQQFDREYRLRRDDGDFCWVHDRGRLSFGPDGQPLRILGSLRIVTDRKASEGGQRDGVIYDALTGHFNRTRLREVIDHAMSRARRYTQQGAFMVVGIDRLKEMADAQNDTACDQVIVGVARRLEDSVRATDVIGRLTDRCFGVVLSRCDEDGLQAAADNIIANISSKPFATGSGSVAATVSIGSVMFPDVAKTPTGAMRGAENAYVEASRRGSGQYDLYRLSKGQELQQSSQSVLGAALLDALRDERIALAYQPVVRSSDGTVAYHETLLRVVGEESGPFDASVFIPLAEQLGHSRRIDRRVLELAVSELDRHADIRLAVNISGLTTSDRSWLRLLSSLVNNRHEIAGRLTIEITETAEIHDVEEAYRFVSAVRDMGCRVALDDFGAGYTSFRQLRSLPVDIVKIDGSFIRGIAQNRENQAFLDSLLAYTTEFGIETVAECVEVATDRDYLFARGVTYLQGWIFGRPELDWPTARLQSSPVA